MSSEQNRPRQALGLDIGSSSIKGAVLDLDSGTVHSIVKEPFPEPVAGLPPGRFEVDPAEIVLRTRFVIEQLLVAAPDARSLFLCGQMGGVALVDEKNVLQTRYLSWRDQRTLDGTLQAAQTRLAPYLARLGNELKPGSMTSLLFWLQQHGDLPERGRPVTVGDLVISQLTRVLPGIEGTQGIGVVDLPTGSWNAKAFQALGIDTLDWGPVVDATSPVGTCSIAGKSLTVYPTIGDQQAALRGAGLKLGDLSINVSTGSQVSAITSEFTPGQYQSRFYFGGTFLNTITHIPAGRALNVLLDLLTALPAAQGLALSNPWEIISSAAASAVSGTEGLRVHPAFFDSPIGREGTISGITTENLTLGNLFRATFESMATTYDQLATRLWPDRNWKRVVLSGGLTRSVPILRELIERYFPGEVVESTADEETLLGLLDLAREVHGR